MAAGPAIRALEADDAATFAAFAEACFREAYGAEFTTEELERLCRAVFAPPVLARLLADGVWVAGDWQGYLALGSLHCPLPELEAPALELARLYVPRRWQGTGVADALMARFLDIARERGRRSVWLQAYRANPRALAFYRRWGFTLTAPWDLECEGIALPHLLMGQNLPR